MTALDWLRSKVKFSSVEIFDIDGKRYKSEFFYFKGRLPTKMIYDLGKEIKNIIKTEEVTENIRIGGQYRSEFNNVEFSKFVCTEIKE